MFLIFLVRAWFWEPEVLQAYLSGTKQVQSKRFDLISNQAVHQLGLNDLLRKILLHQVGFINSANWKIYTFEENFEINSWVSAGIIGFLVLATLFLTMDILASSINKRKPLNFKSKNALQ